MVLRRLSLWLPDAGLVLQPQLLAIGLVEAPLVVTAAGLGLPPSPPAGPVQVERAVLVREREEPEQAADLGRGQRDHRAAAPPFPPGGGLIAAFAWARVTSR
jgi:hypothetical protein